ncbi:MAG: cyclic nucleotide-binding domain-containing protein [Thermodesulfobacteriota bacterium]
MSISLQLLKKNKIFATLEDEVLEEFAGSGEERQFKKGDILTAELVKGDEVYLVLEGEVSIGIELAGQDADIDRLTAEEGEFIGLVNFIGETVEHATTIAVTDLKVLAWKASTCRDICERHPAAGYRIAVGVAKRLVKRMHYFNMNILDSLSWGIE